MVIKNIFYFLFAKTYLIDFTQIHIAKSKFQNLLSTYFYNAKLKN
jgi:hypothetical protein